MAIGPEIVGSTPAGGARITALDAAGVLSKFIGGHND
jgi:hypothetical protein